MTIEVDDIDKGPLRSPIRFKVKFRAFGDAEIDQLSIQVTYLKIPTIDLTSRIMPFANASGIDMPDADVPPGDHFIQLDVKDSNGRVGTRVILLAVVSQ